MQLSAAAATTWPQLAGIAARRMQPAQLLLQLSRHGMHLLPEVRSDAERQLAGCCLQQQGGLQ